MVIRTELEWNYHPQDFFEGCFVLALTYGELVADSGKVILTLKLPTNPVSSAVLLQIKEEVHGIFEVRQLVIHNTFQLNGPTTVQYKEDVTRTFLVDGVTCVINMTVGLPDIAIIDANGNLVSDGEADRLAFHMKIMTSLLPKLMISPILHGMLKSYGQAVRDPQNELVHLYEIRDAIAKLYDGKGRTALGINNTDWSTLGRLANDEPLREGRHRGKKLDELRPATQAELAEARRIACDLIKAYASIL